MNVKLSSEVETNYQSGPHRLSFLSCDLLCKLRNSQRSLDQVGKVVETCERGKITFELRGSFFPWVGGLQIG